MQNIDITKLSHDGRGIGRNAAGKTVFVDGALPGEQVSYIVKNSKRRYIDAQLSAIVKSSPDRVEPECAHFSTCGGCSIQHMSHNLQLATKQQSLLEQLQHFGNVIPQQILPAITGPQWGYRTKARLGVRYVAKDDNLIIGFREKQSNHLADITSCLTLHPLIGTKITLLKSFIRGLEGYKFITHLEVAIGDNHLAIIVRHVQQMSSADQSQWVELAQQQKFDLYLQPGDSESISKVWPEDNDYTLNYKLPEYDLSFQFHPTDFTQVNAQLNCKMVQQAMLMLEVNDTDTILDLFCGLGNFTLPLAKLAHKVVGIEGSEVMVQRAHNNAVHNKITNVNFHAANLTKDQANAVWTKQQFTKLLLDPPRSGAEEILPLIAKLRPNMILYVSCNPATLARDSGILCNEYKYKLASVGIMDMFPQTEHVEAMALFVL